MIELDSVLHMDATELAEALRPESIDLVVTDPLYGIGYESRETVRNNGHEARKTNAGFAMPDELNLTWIEPTVMAMRKDSCLYVFVDWRNMQAVKDALERAGLNVKLPIIWNKLHFGQGDLDSYGNQFEMILFAVKGKPQMFWEGRTGNVWNLTKLSTINNEGNYDNATQKPEELIDQMILHASKPGDVVFDPFCGSGTTGASAKRLKRRFIMGDLDPVQVKIALDRTGVYQEGMLDDRMRALQIALKDRHWLEVHQMFQFDPLTEAGRIDNDYYMRYNRMRPEADPLIRLALMENQGVEPLPVFGEVERFYTARYLQPIPRGLFSAWHSEKTDLLQFVFEKLRHYVLRGDSYMQIRRSRMVSSLGPVFVTVGGFLYLDSPNPDTKPIKVKSGQVGVSLKVDESHYRYEIFSLYEVYRLILRNHGEIPPRAETNERVFRIEDQEVQLSFL